MSEYGPSNRGKWAIHDITHRKEDRFEGLVQEKRNSRKLAMELRISWTNPSSCKAWRTSTDYL